jgi:hypothetical protein
MPAAKRRRSRGAPSLPSLCVYYKFRARAARSRVGSYPPLAPPRARAEASGGSGQPTQDSIACGHVLGMPSAYVTPYYT